MTEYKQYELDLKKAFNTFEVDRRTNYNKVFDWNNIFGNSVYTEFSEASFNDIELINLCINLIKEETDEFEQAIKEKNMPEMYDALCDMLVVMYGMGARTGLYTGDEYHTQLIMKDKIYEVQARLYTNIMGYQFEEYFKTKKNQLKIESLCEFIKIHIEFLEYYSKDEKAKNELKTFFNLSKLIGLTYYAGKELCLNLDQGIHFVNESNMSKSCSTEKEAQETVEWYKKNETRYDTPEYKEVSKNKKKYWIVFNKSSGKILKNINWKIVNFEQVINMQIELTKEEKDDTKNQ
jgi:hypothetical protein